MKCLIIHGSPSKTYQWGAQTVKAFTGQLVGAVRTEMQRLGGVSFEEIYLGDVSLPYCTGCYRCFFDGENHCPHAESVQPIFRKMKEADCLILTSPVYALNVSALVKGFFDLGAYNYHRPCFFEKKALVISSTVGGMAGKVCRYLRDTLMHWGFNRVYTLSAIRRGESAPNAKMKRRCERAARVLHADVLSGRLHSPSLKRVLFYQLWRVASESNRDSADCAYWQKSGMIDHPFFPGIRLGPGKRALGKAMYALFQGMIK